MLKRCDMTGSVRSLVSKANMWFRSAGIIATCSFAVLLSACAGTGVSQHMAIQAVQTGETVYVGCQSSPLHEKPYGYSPITANLAFGTPLQVQSLHGLYEGPGGDSVPSWLGVGSAQQAGYLSGRCIVDAEMLESQREESARQRAQREARLGGRGFSDDEDASTARFSRGMGGAATGGRRNIQAVDMALQAQFETDPVSATRRFRKEGKLGEFAQ